MIPIEYLQTDKRWKEKDYSAPGEKTTVGKAGCGPTSAAMCVASLKDDSVTPASAATWSLQHGFKAKEQGTYYGFITAYLKAYGIWCERVNISNIYKQYNMSANAAHAAALRAIQGGKWVICCMGKGHWTKNGHYILWYGMSGSNVLIRDPNSTKADRTSAPLSLLQSEVKYYWIVNTGASPVKDDEMIEKKSINILGKDYIADTIFKDGCNFISPKVFEDAGFVVTSEGSKAVINLDELKLKISGNDITVPGLNSNSVTYCAVRKLAEAFGKRVEWTEDTVTIE